MNKLEANLSLLAITFYSAILGVFLSSVPSSVPSFAFLAVTNLVGFLFALVFFFGELHRLDKRQAIQSAVLAAELVGFNLFMLLGSSEMDATVISCVITAYFVFVPVAMFVICRKKAGKDSLIGIAVVLIGVFLVMGANFSHFADIRIVYLLIADVSFASYIVTVEVFCSKSNPSILAMGQMFFGFVFTFIAWVIQSLVTHTSMTLPTDLSFWSSVIYVSFFIRGLYGVVQIYAQRYVSAINASLIFSTEVIITLFVSPLIAKRLGIEAAPITPMKIIGCIVIVIGVLAADGSLAKLLRKEKNHAE